MERNEWNERYEQLQCACVVCTCIIHCSNQRPRGELVMAEDIIVIESSSGEVCDQSITLPTVSVPSRMYHSSPAATRVKYLPTYQSQPSQHNFFPFTPPQPYGVPFGSSQPGHSMSVYPPTTIDPLNSSPLYIPTNYPYPLTDQHQTSQIHVWFTQTNHSIWSFLDHGPKCYGCGGDFTQADRSPPFNAVIRHPNY